jgi:alpha-L-fucosidase 2
LIDSLREPGRRTAKMYYGASGWVVHYTTNAWGHTATGRRMQWGQFRASRGVALPTSVGALRVLLDKDFPRQSARIPS